MLTSSTARRSALVSLASALVLSGVALASTPVGAAPHRPAAPAKPKIVASSLSKVSVAPHSTSAWAFGSESTIKGSTYYAVRRSGHRWLRVGIKVPKGTVQLFGIAAASPKSIWLVGNSYKGGVTTETLIERSRGGRFAPVKTKLGAGQLLAVSASSPSNIWAVGDGRTTPGPYVVHWNGKSWKTLPTSKLVGFAFDAVSASSSKNVWFLGNGPSGPVAAVWNGHRIKTMSLKVPTAGGVSSIATSSAKSTWAVGEVVVGTAHPRSDTLTEHWNGKTWKVVHAPSPGITSQPAAVAAAGSRVFLTGTQFSKSGVASPYILRFVRGKWRTQPVASPGKQSQLNSISVSSKSGAAVGYWSVRGICVAHPSPSLPLAESLVGTSWHETAVSKFRTGVPHLRLAPSRPAVPAC